MLPGRRDAEGRLYVTSVAPLPTSTLQGGIAVSALGQVHYFTGLPTKVVNGYPVDDAGMLCVVLGGTIAEYLSAIPRGANGVVVAQVDVAPAATDPYVAGGLRVGPLGGLYLTSAVPSGATRPENTVPPHVSGLNTVGSTLTCDTGTWENNPTAYSYQWFQNNTPLIGETSSTHVVTAGDNLNVLTCRVIATNSGGGNQAFSNPVAIGGARYDFLVTTATNPAPGDIFNTGLVITMNVVDLDGKDHTNSISSLEVGDSIFVGTAEGVVLNAPIVDGAGVARFNMQSWTAPPDGEYVVTVEIAP
jgi:hypothetical protein